MRHPRWFALLILALGCQGELITDQFPGTNQPPTPFVPGLALRLGGTASDQVTAMVLDPGGGFYLAGSFAGSADFAGTGINALTSLGGTDGFLARYSATGALVWALRFGSTQNEQVNAVARDAAGNLYVGGSFEGAALFGPTGGGVIQNSAGGSDAFVAKFTATGVFLWSRRFGGTEADEVSGLVVDGSGGVLAGGTFNGFANSAPSGGTAVQSNGSSDGFVLSLGSDGAIRWTLPIGGTQADAVSAVAITSTGKIVVAGTFRGGADFARLGGTVTALNAVGGADLFVAVYSSDGSFERVRAAGGPNDETLAAGGLALDNQDAALLTGGFSGSVDFDPGLGLVVRTSIGTNPNLFLVRYDATGAILAVTTFGGLGSVTPSRAAVNSAGDVFLTGSFSGPIDFDPGPGLLVRASLGQQGVTDAFVVRLTTGGDLVWVAQVGEATSAAGRANRGAAVALDILGNVILAGGFFGSPDFDPGMNAFRLTSVGESDGFVVKLTSSGALSP